MTRGREHGSQHACRISTLGRFDGGGSAAGAEGETGIMGGMFISASSSSYPSSPSSPPSEPSSIGPAPSSCERKNSFTASSRLPPALCRKNWACSGGQPVVATNSATCSSISAELMSRSAHHLHKTRPRDVRINTPSCAHVLRRCPACYPLLQLRLLDKLLLARGAAAVPLHSQMLHLYCRPFADAPPGDTRPADALTQLFEKQTKVRPRHTTPRHTSPQVIATLRLRHAGSARRERQGRGARE